MNWRISPHTRIFIQLKLYSFKRIKRSAVWKKKPHWRISSLMRGLSNNLWRPKFRECGHKKFGCSYPVYRTTPLLPPCSGLRNLQRCCFLKKLCLLSCPLPPSNRSRAIPPSTPSCQSCPPSSLATERGCRSGSRWRELFQSPSRSPAIKFYLRLQLYFTLLTLSLSGSFPIGI